MILRPMKPPLVRSIFRNCCTKFNLFARPSSSFSATSATPVGDTKAPIYPPSSSDSPSKTDDVKASTEKDDRPFIFLWTKDQQSAEGDGTVVRLPECDVVYKDEPKEKPARKIRRRVHHFLSSQPVEDRLLKHYLSGKTDLSNTPSIFCVYNAGESTIPEKLLQAKAQRVVILEPSKSEYLKTWQGSASRRNERLLVKPYDFNRWQAGRIRDFHNNKGVDSLCQLFAKAGAVSIGSDDAQRWWGEGTRWLEDPPIRIMGVADPYKEHGLFATLLYARITRSSIYEFGPTELIAAVSAQQYLDFHPKSAEEKFTNKDRSRVPKLVRWRARLYNYLFRIDLVDKCSFDAFTPEISAKKLKYDRIASGGLYKELGIDMDKMYWVSLRPRKCDELEALVSQDYGDPSDSEIEGHADLERRRQFAHLAGFTFMYKTLSRHPRATTMKDFLRDYFSGVEVEPIDPETKLDSIQLHDLVQTYTTLAKEGGTKFYNSPFYNSAQEFADSILCPVGPEEKKDGRKKT